MVSSATLPSADRRRSASDGDTGYRRAVRTVDLAFGLLILVAAFAGVRMGMLRALPLAGAAAGVVLASRVPLLIGQDLDSDYALNIAIVAALALGGIGAV